MNGLRDVTWCISVAYIPRRRIDGSESQHILPVVDNNRVLQTGLTT